MEDTPLPLLLVKTTYDLFQNSKNIKFPTQVIIERGGNYYLDLFITHCINILIIMITAEKCTSKIFKKKNKVILKIFAMVGPWLKEQHVYK